MLGLQLGERWALAVVESGGGIFVYVAGAMESRVRIRMEELELLRISDFACIKSEFCFCYKRALDIGPTLRHIFWHAHATVKSMLNE